MVFTYHSGTKKTECIAIINIKHLIQTAFFRNRWIESLIFLEKEKKANPES